MAGSRIRNHLGSLEFRWLFVPLSKSLTSLYLLSAEGTLSCRSHAFLTLMQCGHYRTSQAFQKGQGIIPILLTVLQKFTHLLLDQKKKYGFVCTQCDIIRHMSSALMMEEEEIHSCVTSKEFKRGIGSLFDPYVNTMGRQAILTVTYGGELLYLQIWRDHSAWSVHIIVTAWFTAW